MKLFVLYAAFATFASSFPEASAQLNVSSKSTKLISADTSLASGVKGRSLRTANTYPSIDTEERVPYAHPHTEWKSIMLDRAMKGDDVGAMVAAAMPMGVRQEPHERYRSLIKEFLETEVTAGFEKELALVRLNLRYMQPGHPDEAPRRKYLHDLQTLFNNFIAHVTNHNWLGPFNDP